MEQITSLNPEDFSLTKGGPFFKLMIRSGLIKPDFARPARRAIFFALFIWLPLFFLSIAQGLAFGGPASLPPVTLGVGRGAYDCHRAHGIGADARLDCAAALLGSHRSARGLRGGAWNAGLASLDHPSKMTVASGWKLCPTNSST